jgi:hypothetical protein
VFEREKKRRWKESNGSLSCFCFLHLPSPNIFLWQCSVPTTVCRRILQRAALLQLATADSKGWLYIYTLIWYYACFVMVFKVRFQTARGQNIPWGPRGQISIPCCLRASMLIFSEETRKNQDQCVLSNWVLTWFSEDISCKNWIRKTMTMGVQCFL